MDHVRGKFTIPSDVRQAEELSDRLAALLKGRLESQALNTLRLGLREMLINAIEHGNLEISFEEKTTETDKDDYLAFLVERQKQPAYAGRCVTVEYHIAPRRAAFRISDEGRGFDHRKFSSLTAQGDTELAHGRGIRMTLRVFDRVRYNTRGNRVTLWKKIS
jgi:anti-sigma regulatory factor (Ser/Thr protein kinase)